MVTLMKEDYAIYKAFKKLSYYLHDTRATITPDNAPLHKFLTAHTMNSKVSNWGPEIASVIHVIFEHIKRTANILAYHNSKHGCMDVYMLHPEE